MIILIVEDLDEQVEMAKRELTALGFKVAVARTLKDAKRLIENLKSVLKGIITDVHFPESNFMHEKTADKPNGLAVVAFAVLRGIPVAVCSDVDHHFCAYVRDVIDVLAMHPRYAPHRIPFAMDHKDWRQAGEELMNIIDTKTQRKEKTS